MRARVVATTAVLTVATGCGLGWIDDHGIDDRGLPTLGVNGYRRLPVDDTTGLNEPYVVSELGVDHTAPTAVRADDGTVRIWSTRAPLGMAEAAQIAYSEWGDRALPPAAPPRVVLVADQAWEQGRVAAPAVLIDGGQLVMYYQGGVATPAIGRAVSTDGVTWVKDAAPVLTDAEAPAAARFAGVTHLLVTRPGQPGLWQARGDGQAFTLDPAPIVVARPNLAEAFDGDAVREPSLVVHTSDTGRAVLLAFFVGTDLADQAPAVGYAASVDGVTWVRPDDPDPTLAASATGPTVVLTPSTGLMLFSERDRNRLAITAAVHP